MLLITELKWPPPVAVAICYAQQPAFSGRVVHCRLHTLANILVRLAFIKLQVCMQGMRQVLLPLLTLVG